MTAVQTAPGLDDRTRELAALFVEWLETGRRPADMFAADVFIDFSLPHWRLQTSTADDGFGLREQSHPYRGSVRVEALDATSRGFLIQFEERWVDEGRHWYCRELIHAVVADGLIGELAVYCTGDWDEARQRLHHDQVRLVRP